MDGLDTFDSSIDSGQESNIGSSPEAAREKSEKQKEAYSKALAGISRSRKDEQKSQLQDDLLAKVLSISIRDGHSDDIIMVLSKLTDAGFPSFVSIGVISLAAPDAVNTVLSHYRLVSSFPVLHSRVVPVEFHQNILTPDEKMYINAWVELFFTLVRSSPSSVYIKRFYTLLDTPSQKQVLIESISTAFAIFLSKLSITYAKEITVYSQFITSEIQKSLSSISFEDIETGKLTHL